MSGEEQSQPDSGADAVLRGWYEISMSIARVIEFHVGKIEQLGKSGIGDGEQSDEKMLLYHHLEEIRTSVANGLDAFRDDINGLGLSADAISQMESHAEAYARGIISSSMATAEMRGISWGEPASASGLDDERSSRGAGENDQTPQNANASTPQRDEGENRYENDATPQRQRRAGAAAQRDNNQDLSPGDEAETANTTLSANAAMPQRRQTRSMTNRDSGDDTGGHRGEIDQNNDTSENAENREANGGGDAGAAKTKGKKGKKRKSKGKRKKRKKKNTPSNDDEQHSSGGSCADGNDARGEEGNPTGEEQPENGDTGDLFTLEIYSVVAEKYRSSDESVAVATTYLNGNIARLIDGIFDTSQPDLAGIPALARNYALVLSTLRKYTDVEARRLVLQAKRDLVDAEENARDILADSLPALSASSTLGSFLSAMPDDDDDNEEEREETDESGEENGGNEVSALAEATEKIAVLMRAIGVHDSNAAGSEDGREGNVTKKRLHDIIKVGRHTSRIAKHLNHIFLQHEVYCILTVHEILSNFSKTAKKKMAKIISDVEALAKAVDPCFDFNKQTTASEYIEKVILRALASENHRTRTAATEVMRDLYECTTQTSGNSRKEIICEGGYRKAELKRFDGSVSETGVAYCSDPDDDKHTRLRKKVCTTYWLFLIKTIIERMESVRTHFPYGHTESILLLSPTIIRKKCTFLLTDTIVAGHFGRDAKKMKQLTEAMKKRRKEHFDGGKRIVIIDCDEQLESLRQLAISD